MEMDNINIEIQSGETAGHRICKLDPKVAPKRKWRKTWEKMAKTFINRLFKVEYEYGSSDSDEDEKDDIFTDFSGKIC